MTDDLSFRFDHSMRYAFGDHLVEESKSAWGALPLRRRFWLALTMGAEVWCIQWCKERSRGRRAVSR